MSSRFNKLDEALQTSDPAPALECLIEELDRAGEYRPLLDALLLKARYDLGLPLVHVGSLNSLPEAARGPYEERYVHAIREVGRKLLSSGDLAGAWAYFRAIGEPEPVAESLNVYEAGDDPEEVGRIIDIAFNQGANPRRGFQLILNHYGTCSAITALEQLPNDRTVWMDCVERLVRHLHEQLLANVRADLERRGDKLPENPTSITRLVEGRDELFADEAYHIDISHLSSTVRHSIMLTDRDALALAVELTEYGRRLSPRLQFEGMPPFENTFEDHRRYLRALLGDEVDAAVAYFRGRAEESESDDLESTLPAQVLVNLLVRLGRHDDAIEVAASKLQRVPESMLGCPGIPELCQQSGKLDRLATIARDQGNLVNYLAARLAARHHAEGR
jgi:hypothetical protein